MNSIILKLEVVKTMKIKRTMSAQEIADKIGGSVSTVYYWADIGCPHDIVQVGLREFKKFNYKEVYDWYMAKKEMEKRNRKPRRRGGGDN